MSIAPANLTPEIICQDEDLLVLNKPAGMVVNKAKSTQAATVQSWAEDYLDLSNFSQGKLSKNEWQDLVPADFDDSYGSPEEIFLQRQGMVHRLDKETSGVLLWAKNPGALVHLLAQFRERQTQKTYLCLAHGKFGVEEDVISFPIARSNNNRQKFEVKIEGRPAKTWYRVVDFYPDLNWQKMKEVLSEADFKKLKKQSKSYQGFSLVECQPKTGRTHQIRVHLKHIKHPLVGDSKYVGKKRMKLDNLWCTRHFLHARQIELTHPRTGEQVKYQAKLSTDLNQVLSLLAAN